MNIQIGSSGRNFSFSLPTKLILSRFVIRMVVKNASAAKALESLPPDAADKIITELRHVKETYGSWELVYVRSADGESVKIAL